MPSIKAKRLRERLTWGLVILSVVGLTVADYVQRQKRSPLKNFELTRALGNPNAPLKIVEFMDFQCRQCARALPLLENYLSRFPDEIFLQQRYYPIAKFNSFKSAKNAECAARQDKFWPMYEHLLRHQEQWRTASDPQPIFDGFARESGVDMEKFEACLQDPTVEETIVLEQAAGQSLFVRTTPTFFVNNKMAVGVFGLQTELEKVLPKDFGQGISSARENFE